MDFADSFEPTRFLDTENQNYDPAAPPVNPAALILGPVFGMLNGLIQRREPLRECNVGRSNVQKLGKGTLKETDVMESGTSPFEKHTAKGSDGILGWY